MKLLPHPGLFSGSDKHSGTGDAVMVEVHCLVTGTFPLPCIFIRLLALCLLHYKGNPCFHKQQLNTVSINYKSCWSTHGQWLRASDSPECNGNKLGTSDIAVWYSDGTSSQRISEFLKCKFQI